MSAHINVRTRTPHADCKIGSVWTTGKDGYLHETRHQVGDVLRCEHGKVMLCDQIGYQTRTSYDVTTPLWRTLSKVWTPHLHRAASEAIQALDGAPQ